MRSDFSLKTTETDRPTVCRVVHSRLRLSGSPGCFFMWGLRSEIGEKNTNHSAFVCDASPARRKAECCDFRAHSIIYTCGVELTRFAHSRLELKIF